MSKHQDTDKAAGRVCPLDYNLRSDEFERVESREADVLYLAGGLYGNPFALHTIEQMLTAESGRTALCLNGDFHWFDADTEWFGQIDAATARHDRTRGNVETEISRGGDTDAGCGCAYPDTVDDADVERSNNIMRKLGLVAGAALSDKQIAALGQLPAVACYQVGETRVGVTHGDDQSLAGWSFAENELAGTWSDGLADRMVAQGLDVFASSHTCLPIASSRGPNQSVVINNGSAGMANFRSTTYGVVSRIAHRDMPGPSVEPLYECTTGDVRISALPVRFKLSDWLELFDSVWVNGSAAETSYRDRICHGPNYQLQQAVSGGFQMFPTISSLRNAA